MTNAEARQKKTDDRGIFAVRLKGGRLAKVLAKALIGRCFSCQQALALFCSVVGGLSLAGCEKAKSFLKHAALPFIYELFLENNHETEGENYFKKLRLLLKRGQQP